jgi:4-hydroxybenzoate polyprenyltransferase
MKTCPVCGLPNPDKASKCPCTYDFQAGKRDLEKSLNSIPKTEKDYLLNQFKKKFIAALFLISAPFIFLFLFSLIEEFLGLYGIIIGIIVAMILFLKGMKELRELLKQKELMQAWKDESENNQNFRDGNHLEER